MQVRTQSRSAGSSAKARNVEGSKRREAREVRAHGKFTEWIDIVEEYSVVFIHYSYIFQRT